MPFSIIYVDDDASVRYVISELLRSAGARVRDFAAGEDAIRAATTDSPDAMLIDLNMPAMDGFQLARIMRLTHHELRLVALSGQATQENRNDAMDAGFDRFLAKPASIDALLAALGKGA